MSHRLPGQALHTGGGQSLEDFGASPGTFTIGHLAHCSGSVRPYLARIQDGDCLDGILDAHYLNGNRPLPGTVVKIDHDNLLPGPQA